MASTIDTAVIVVIGVFFAGMGVYALAAPAALIRPFGITLGESAARSEVRAVYGGFGLAIAGVLAYAVVEADVRTRHPSNRRRRAGGDGVRSSRLRGSRRPHGVLSELVLLPCRDHRGGWTIRNFGALIHAQRG